MAEYELVNPSDKFIFEAPCDRVAALVGVCFGPAYGVVSVDGRRVVLGIGLFGYDWSHLLNAYGWADYAAIKADYIAMRVEIADALETGLYAGSPERKALLIALDGVPDRVERMARFNEERRSSCNDIAGRAHEMARELRAAAASSSTGAATTEGGNAESGAR